MSPNLRKKVQYYISNYKNKYDKQNYSTYLFYLFIFIIVTCTYNYSYNLQLQAIAIGYRYRLQVQAIGYSLKLYPCFNGGYLQFTFAHQTCQKARHIKVFKVLQLCLFTPLQFKTIAMYYRVQLKTITEKFPKRVFFWMQWILLTG